MGQVGEFGCKNCCGNNDAMTQLDIVDNANPNDVSFEDAKTLDNKHPQQANDQWIDKNTNKSNDKWASAWQFRRTYTRMQAMWRGYIDRRQMNILIKNDLQISVHYFNFRETQETIGKKKVNLGTIRQAPGIKKAVYNYKNRGIYDGEWFGGFRHGYGTMKWNDGSTYRGQWSFGKASGKGVFSFPNGDQFDGRWTCDKTLTAITQQKIQSNGYMWLINKEKSMRTSPESDTNGQVTAEKINDIKLSLNAVRQKLKNPSKMQTFNKAVLKTREHKLEKYENGDRYEGNFVDGKKDGLGNKTWANGDVYDGEWRDNCQHGWGQTQWVDGSRYTGMFANNLKEGIGSYYWDDGSKYVGEWKQNLMQGIGKYKWPDGRSYAGNWSNGMMHGLGMFKWPENKRFEGYWALGKKNGNGITTYPDGRKSLDVWKNGNKTNVK